jgi:hypothetical protein
VSQYFSIHSVVSFLIQAQGANPMLQKKQFYFLEGKPARKLPSEHVFNVNREEKLTTIHKNKEKKHPHEKSIINTTTKQQTTNITTTAPTVYSATTPPPNTPQS